MFIGLCKFTSLSFLNHKCKLCYCRSFKVNAKAQGIHFATVSAKKKVLAYCLQSIFRLQQLINLIGLLISALRNSWALLFGKVMILLITVAGKIETCSLAIKIVIN